MSRCIAVHAGGKGQCVYAAKDGERHCQYPKHYWESEARATGISVPEKTYEDGVRDGGFVPLSVREAAKRLVEATIAKPRSWNYDTIDVRTVARYLLHEHSIDMSETKVVKTMVTVFDK